MGISDTLARWLPWFLRRGGECGHVAALAPVGPPGAECEECVVLGDTWFHLRQCLVCGQVRCCDQSKNKHATGHFHSSGHPVMRSAEPGEGWRWCYVDERMV